jgi:hydroxymethylpyrimidine pyrophosphatase-like HAD family hydrolase
MKKTIEEFLYPNNKKLSLDSYTISTTIVDCELDEYVCTFNGHEVIEINTEGYTHITLDIDKLKSLIHLTKQAEMMYNKLNKL